MFDFYNTILLLSLVSIVCVFTTSGDIGLVALAVCLFLGLVMSTSSVSCMISSGSVLIIIDYGFRWTLLTSFLGSLLIVFFLFNSGDAADSNDKLV